MQPTRPTTTNRWKPGETAANGPAHASQGPEDYRQRLDKNPEWALEQGGQHFQERSDVHAALRKIARRLEDLGVPYAIAGGMALFRHGFRRFTEDVDVLVTADGLRTIHEKLEGLGYVVPFVGSKNLRDAENGVRIEFLVTGAFPGDGKPKPVAFPPPDSVVESHEGIKYLTLTALVELKLASGMTNPLRLKDLADVLELIQVLSLPRQFADGLNPFVQEKFRELWTLTQQAGSPDV
jgi:hypothetical protein